MTDEMLSNLIQDQIEENFSNNMSAFAHSIASVLPQDYEIDPDLTKMLIQTAKFTSQFSVQFVFRILDEMGVLHLPPDDAPILFPVD